MAAGARLTLDGQAASHGGCDSVGDGQAEADSGKSGPPRGFATEEGLKNVWQLIGRQTLTLIGHAERDTGIFDPGADVDRGAGLAIFACVFEQVIQKLSEKRRADAYAHWRIARDRCSQVGGARV